MAISFHNADLKFLLRNRTALKKFIAQQIFAAKRQVGSLTFVFCSDEYLLQINRQFLKHDYYTDIITFPLGENEQLIEGEIYISIDRVKENSLKFSSSAVKGKPTNKDTAFINELQQVMFHGVLHLLGYKDKTKAHKAEMRAMEDKWLKKFEKGLLPP